MLGIMRRRASILAKGSLGRLAASHLLVLGLRRRTARSELRFRGRWSRSWFPEIAGLMTGTAEEFPLRRWASRAIDLLLLVAQLFSARLVRCGWSRTIARDASGRVKLRWLLVLLSRAGARSDAGCWTPSSSRRWSTNEQFVHVPR